MGIFGGTPSNTKGSDADEQRHRADLRRMNEEIQMTQDDLNKSTREIEALHSDIAKQTAEEKKIQQILTSAETDAKKLEEELRKKTAEISQKKKDHERVMTEKRATDTALKEKTRRHLILEGELKKLRKDLHDQPH